MDESNINLYILFGIVAFAVVSLLIFGLAQYINEFVRELKYLNIEIGRTHGSERRYWLRRRRRLWLSLIPFVKY